MADTQTVGADWTLQVSDLRDAATGSYLNSATVTYVLYTGAGAAVSGGTGTLTYVSASNGTYRGTVESTVTSTLTAGAYYALVTVVQSGYDGLIRLDINAVAPGEALIDPQSWYEMTGVTVTGIDATTIARMCSAVSELIARKCYPVLLTPRTLTLWPVDAPVDRYLLLPRPVRSISALYYHGGAAGDSSVLDLTADLLVAGTDYQLVLDDVLTGTARAGKVLRLNNSVWGWNYLRPPQQLGYKLVPEPGAVFVSGAFGPATVNPAAQSAAAVAVSLMYNRRKEGAAYGSESWNGRSQSVAGPVSAEAAVNSPEVLGILQSAGLLSYHVA